MDFDPKILVPAIAAFAGAIVGSLIRELSSFYQVYREDKRTLKKLLYNQLDIWFEVNRCDPSRFLAAYYEKLGNNLIRRGASKEQIDTQLEQTRPQLAALLQKVRIGEPEKLQQRYQHAVEEVAKVDPLLAYRLSGSPDFESAQTKVDALFEGIKNRIGENISEVENRFADHLVSAYKEKLLQQTIRSLRKDTLYIAWRISTSTMIRAYFALRDLDRRLEKELDSEIDKMVGMAVSFFKNAATPGGSN